MAVLFDESDDYYVITDSADLDTADADWYILFWYRSTDATGSAYQYFVSNNSFGATPSINIYLQEDSSAGADVWTANLVADDTSAGQANCDLGAAGIDIDDGVPRIVCVTYDASTNGLYTKVATPGGSSVPNASAVMGNSQITSPGDWNIGRRTDGNADRYYGSYGGELAKGDLFVSDELLQALADGLPIPYLATLANMDFYYPFKTSVETEKNLIGGAGSAARQSAPTEAEHFPIFMPAARVERVTVAAGGISPPSGLALLGVGA